MKSSLRLLYTGLDTARIIGCCPETLRLLVARGRIAPKYRTDRGIQLYEPQDVEHAKAEFHARRAR